MFFSRKAFSEYVVRNPSLIFFTMGLLLTLFSSWQIWDSNMDRLQKKFEIDTYFIAGSIETNLQEHALELEALHSLFISIENVDRKSFALFVSRPLSARTGIRAFEWIPVVPDQQRMAFEKGGWNGEGGGVPIIQRDEIGRVIPASFRDLYYPVDYVQPLKGNEPAIGYDLGSDAIRRAALEKARDTGEITATAPIRLVQETEQQSGFLLFEPVYSQGEEQKPNVSGRKKSLKGFVLGVFRSGDMVKDIFDHVSARNIKFRLIDVSDNEAAKIFATNGDWTAERNLESKLALTAIDIRKDHDFPFAGRKWRIEIEATPAYVITNLAMSHWTMLLVGLLFTFILTIITALLSREIRDRKKISIELQASQAELIKTNEELGITIQSLHQTQGQMINQEKLAGIGQLAAGVAHEINNPLSYVTGNINVLQKYVSQFNEYIADCKKIIAKAAEKLQEDLVQKVSAKEKKLAYIQDDTVEIFRDVINGLARIGKIVDGLRAFSRIDRQQCVENYDLNEGISATLEVASHEIKYSATVETHLAELPLIEAIGGEVNQVLLNIIVNAAQAIGMKKLETLGTIVISTWADKESVFCSVEDNGIGISGDDMKNIFNPFFTTKPVGKGTGLGMSISYDIVVNKHHGDIFLNSVEGEGAKFVIRLPLAQPRLQQNGTTLEKRDDAHRK